MSVPEPLRHKGRLEVHVKAQYLASYTIKILANDKTFPPEIDGELVKRIKDSAISIYAKAWSANKINASTNKVNREMRLLTRAKVDESYQSWRSHAAKGNSWKLLKRMDAYYNSLWRCETCA